jgi:hypothetical protein
MAILNEFTQTRGQHNINVIQAIFNLNGRLATTVSFFFFKRSLSPTSLINKFLAFCSNVSQDSFKQRR